MTRSRVDIAFAIALAIALACVPCVFSGSARADGPYDGPWVMTPLAESFTVQQWSSACGPPPASDTMMPGGPATVTASGGELVIGAARPLRTDQCLDPLPTLARTVHSSDGRSWRTRCATPQSDPRHAVVNTAFFLSPGDGSISIAETGRYEFTINDARCIADVQRSATLTRVAPAVPATATATAAPVPTQTAAPTPTAPPPSSCATPGDPARLEVRPSRKLLKLGDSFSFRGVVLDESGCATGTPIRWSVGPITFRDGQAHAATPTIDAAGKLTVPAQDFAEGTFDVTATAAGKSARASVEVSSPADYEALLAQSGLDSNGELAQPAVAVLATSSIGASNARAEDTARRRRTIFIGVVVGLALALGAAGLVVSRRSKRARAAEEKAAEERHAEKMREYERQKTEREAQHAAQMKAHRESVALAQQQAAAAAARGVDTGPMFCPSCRREYPPRTVFCAVDSNRLVAMAGHENLMRGPAGGVCPVCKRGYNPGVRACPEHGEELVPAAVAQAPSSEARAPRGKICPTCGGRFEGNAAFCGKDGTQLVLVN